MGTQRFWVHLYSSLTTEVMMKVGRVVAFTQPQTNVPVLCDIKDL